VGREGGHSEALAVIPLALGDQVFGVAAFGWDEDRRFDYEDRQFLAALRDQCAQALERARLYELERETARTLGSPRQ
jgi:GAF domain-containing protein